MRSNRLEHPKLRESDDVNVTPAHGEGGVNQTGSAARVHDVSSDSAKKCANILCK